MRIEIAEQLAVCAIKACDVLTEDKEGKRVQRNGMYAKVASFGSSLKSLGLIPTAMRFENDRPNNNGNERENAQDNHQNNDQKKPGDYRVNDAVYKTLKEFVALTGVADLWKPDERLKTLVESQQSLLQLYRTLANAADYELVKEYSMLACASLKLALNTYPDYEKSKDNNSKGV